MLLVWQAFAMSQAYSQVLSCSFLVHNIWTLNNVLMWSLISILDWQICGAGCLQKCTSWVGLPRVFRFFLILEKRLNDCELRESVAGAPHPLSQILRWLKILSAQGSACVWTTKAATLQSIYYETG